ncbi:MULTISPECIES: hemerythrin domain-containing protein [unclassified Micromonospora]|uniref:hemerythrin domain-containing protein n=1 Tax=Micromonospora sp. NPDC049903 TaxID=3364276 RepID=UPI0037A4C251
MADSRDMYVVHSLFRREFPAAAALVRTVPADDAPAAARVADHVLLLTGALHTHHSGEDEHVWPKLRQRGPDEIAPLVETMESQHESLHAALADVEDRATVWRRTASVADREALAAAVEALIAPMSAHLDAEETHVLPLIDKYLTDEEWAEAGKHGMASAQKSQLPMIFGMLLHDARPEHTESLKAVVPAPVWFVLSRLGPVAYGRYVRRLGLDRVSAA